MKGKAVSLFAITEKQEIKNNIGKITGLLKRKGIKVFLNKIDRSVTLAIALGGDGTMLRTAKELYSSNVPVLGINLGQMGFLTEADISGWWKEAEKALMGKLDVEERLMLEAGIGGRKNHRKYFALNDVVVKNGNTARVINLGLELNGRSVAEYVADGLIVSTPTGSTAYSLSSGGPVVSPDLPVIVITPICPHTLTFRPIVVSSGDLIKIKVLSSSREVILSLDGQQHHKLKIGDEVSINRAKHPFKVITNRKRNYYSVLRSKLKWGER